MGCDSKHTLPSGWASKALLLLTCFQAEILLLVLLGWVGSPALHRVTSVPGWANLGILDRFVETALDRDGTFGMHRSKWGLAKSTRILLLFLLLVFTTKSSSHFGAAIYIQSKPDAVAFSFLPLFCGLWIQRIPRPQMRSRLLAGHQALREGQ